MPFKDKSERKEYVARWYQKNKDITKERAAQWHSENKDKAAQSVTKWRAEHPEEHKQQNAKYRDNHAEQRRQYNSLYAKEHPEQHAVSEQRRRARKAKAIDDLTTEQAAEILAAGCLFCGTHDDLTIAHDIPIAKKGNTTRANTFCLCMTCNRKMYTKTLAQTIKQKFLPFL